MRLCPARMFHRTPLAPTPPAQTEPRGDTSRAFASPAPSCTTLAAWTDGGVLALAAS